MTLIHTGLPAPVPPAAERSRLQAGDPLGRVTGQAIVSSGAQPSDPAPRRSLGSGRFSETVLHVGKVGAERDQGSGRRLAGRATYQGG